MAESTKELTDEGAKVTTTVEGSDATAAAPAEPSGKKGYWPEAVWNSTGRVDMERFDFRTGSSTSSPSKTRRNFSRIYRWPTRKRSTEARRGSSRRSRRRSRETPSRSAQSSSSHP